MVKKFPYSVNIFMVFIFFASCATTPEIAGRLKAGEKAPLYGMIYDGLSRPINSAMVIADDKPAAISDIEGRFVINQLPQGRHEIEIKNADYEAVKLDFDFISRSQVLYARMVSADDLLQQAESLASAGDFSTAIITAERGLNLAKDNDTFAYFIALCYYRLNRADKVRETLAPLTAKHNTSIAVWLLLADTSQYLDIDLEAAKNYLLSAKEVFPKNIIISERINALSIE